MISVCIVCRNEADKLDPCLDSVKWADEIVLMDLESTDETAATATRYGARVVRHAPVPIVEMVRNAIADEARGEWILVLDPDERISPALANELQVQAQRDDIDAIIIPRMNFDLGYPPSNRLQRYEPQLRMYRKAAVSWPAVPNALPDVPQDRVYRVPARDEFVMLHDRSRTIPEVLDRSIRYAPLEAQSMIERGQVFSAKAMFSALGSTAFKQFVVAQAWRDGVPGILRAAILLNFKFYVWAAFWQQSGAKRTPEDDRFLRRIGLMFEIARGIGWTIWMARRAIHRVARFGGRKASSASSR